ncbi:hypothetical protein VPH35_004621 [Triticum aestivum]
MLGPAASCGRGVGPGPEVQRGVQLRRLDHGHGQPVHEREANGDHVHAAALRRDLLRHPHLPVLRRPRHRRLPQHQVWGAVPTAVQGERHGLQAGRQHGHHGGDGHGRALLPGPRPLRQDLEQWAHQPPNPVVPADHGHRVRRRRRLQALPAGLAGGVRRVRRERLQRDAVRQLQRGPGEEVHAQDRQHHHQGRGEGGGHGGQGRGGARGAPHRLLPHLPHRLRHQQQRRLRQPRLPPQVQRSVHVPQQPAPGQDRPPPEALRPGGADHVRRLLLRRLRHGPEPQEIRFQRGFRGVLRLRGRQVQLRQQSAVRDAGRGGVRQPGRPPQLGRHPPHRGSIQAHQRRLAQRALLQPAHPPHINIILFIMELW